MSTPLVIAAHGTRDLEGQQACFALVDRVRAKLPGVEVSAGFVELVEPEIPAAIEAALAGKEPSGDVDLAMVPLLLATGGHLQDDLPEALEAAPGFDARIGRPLQPDPRLIQALLQRIETAAQDWLPRDVTVVLVGRGCKTTSANADHYRLARTVMEEFGATAVEPAFIQVNRPSVPDALNAAAAAGARKIVIAQHFLFPGKLRTWLAEQAEAWLQTHPGIELRIAGVIGDCDELAEVVIDRYRELLGSEGQGQGAPVYLSGLKLQDRQVVVVGGGAVAQRRIPRLLEAGAKVRVIAPNVGIRVGKMAVKGEIELVKRAFEAGDTQGAWFVLAATNDQLVNQRVTEEAEANHTFCVRADQADLGSAFTPAVEQAGGLTVAVVGNRNPNRSVRVRDELLKALQG